MNTPNAVIDFSDRVPPEFGHRAVATIDANGFRNPGTIDPKPPGEYWIGIFGGSVAFGVPVSTDAHTIAGCLEKRLSRMRVNGGRVRVLNFAIPGGQQPQQLLIAAFKRKWLDAVISFDGVNEVVVPSCYNRDSVPADFPYFPYYSTLYGNGVSEEQAYEAALLKRRQRAFAGKPKWMQRLFAGRHDRDIADRRQRLHDLEDNAAFQSLFLTTTASAEHRAIGGADNWLRHTETTAMMCRSAGIRSLHVVQPIPDRGKSLTDEEHDRLSSQEEIVRVRAAGYDRVLQHARELQRQGLQVEDFSGVFADCREAIYTDLIHFEDRGSEIVAERLARHLASWDEFRG